MLQILGILENFDLSRFTFENADFLHLFTQASKLAYADRDAYVADPDFVTVPTQALVNENYLARRARHIDPRKDMGHALAGPMLEAATLPPSHQGPDFPSTTHLSIVDVEGNAVAFTSSIENAFGSTLMVRGFLLNNQLTDFSFVPEVGGEPVANRIQPGKRPRSSMAPTLVFDAKTDAFVLSIGSPGGARIINYVAKALVAVLDFKMDLQDAISLPNVANRNGATELEKETPLVRFAQELQRRGHEVTLVDLNSGLHGVGRKGSDLAGGADPRRDGIATGELRQ